MEHGAARNTASPPKKKHTTEPTLLTSQRTLRSSKNKTFAQPLGPPTRKKVIPKPIPLFPPPTFHQPEHPTALETLHEEGNTEYLHLLPQPNLDSEDPLLSAEELPEGPHSRPATPNSDIASGLEHNTENFDIFNEDTDTTGPKPDTDNSNTPEEDNTNTTGTEDNTGNSDTTEEENPNAINMAEETNRLIQQVIDRLGAAGAEGEPTIRQMITNQERRITQSDSRALCPTPFYGYSTDDPKAFIDRFNTYATLQSMEDGRKISACRMLLQGPADIWYLSLPEASKATWEAFKTAFLEAFGGSETQWLLEQKMEDRKMLPGETVETYINDVRKLGNRAGASDTDIKRALVRGLTPELRSFVISQNPKTLDETISKIKIGETAKVGEGSAALNSATVKELKTHLQKWEDDQKKALASIKMDIKEASPYNGGSMDRNSMRCFNCNMPGHFAKECTMRPACRVCGRNNHATADCFSTRPPSYNNRDRGQSNFNRRSRDYQPRLQRNFQNNGNNRGGNQRSYNRPPQNNGRWNPQRGN